MSHVQHATVVTLRSHYHTDDRIKIQIWKKHSVSSLPVSISRYVSCTIYQLQIPNLLGIELTPPVKRKGASREPSNRTNTPEPRVLLPLYNESEGGPGVNVGQWQKLHPWNASSNLSILHLLSQEVFSWRDLMSILICTLTWATFMTWHETVRVSSY